MTTAWVFPGQGSQAVGMATALGELPEAQAALAEATAILGWSPLTLSSDDLALTRYTQPALYVVACLLADHLKTQAKPDCVAGHSLGEFSALYVAGVYDFATGLSLVHQRAQLMEQARTGTMTAVMGFDRDKLVRLCAETEGVTLANDNSPDQVVITGDPEGVAKVASALGAKRTVPLAVSGAFHSPFMAEAAIAFTQLLETTTFAPAQVPVYSNVSALATQDPDQLKRHLAQQMTAPVRWRETLLHMAADGVTELWEVGPGKVLTGLAKRTIPDVARQTINVPTTLES